MKEVLVGIPHIYVKNAEFLTAPFVKFIIELSDPSGNLVSDFTFANTQNPLTLTAGVAETDIPLVAPGNPNAPWPSFVCAHSGLYHLRVRGWVIGQPDVSLGSLWIPIDTTQPLPPKLLSTTSLDSRNQEGFRVELDFSTISKPAGAAVAMTMGKLNLLPSLFSTKFAENHFESGQPDLSCLLNVTVTGADFPTGVIQLNYQWNGSVPWSDDGSTAAPIPLVGGTNTLGPTDVLHLHLTAPITITAKVTLNGLIWRSDTWSTPGPDNTPAGNPGETLHWSHIEARDLGSATIQFDPNLPPPYQVQISTIATSVLPPADVNDPGYPASPPPELPTKIGTFSFTCDFAPLSETEQNTTLKILGVEITQAVQRYHDTFGLSDPGADDSVPLLSGKDTLFRVYLDPGLSEDSQVIYNITGVLTFDQDGQTIALDALSPLTARTPQLVRRNTLADTLNFFLPARFARNSFAVTIKAGNSLVHSAPFSTPTLTFQTPPHMNIIHLSMEAWGSPTLTKAQYLAVANQITRIYPVPTNPGSAISFWIIPGHETLALSHDLTDADGWSNLIDELEDIQEDAEDWQKLYAMLPQPPATVKLLFGGKARQHDNVAVGLAVTDVMAHEIGHLYGLKHAPGADPGGISPDNVDPDFRPGNGTIGDVGVDVQSVPSSNSAGSAALVFDTNTGDLMSYHKTQKTTIGNRWIGPYDFGSLIDRIG